MMDRYAQTNVQLYSQLLLEGYTSKDIALVCDAYELGMRLFAGLFLPSGRTFIDHLVGTGSILAWLNVPVELVAAGLIHAAYLHGDFGTVKAGISDQKRREIRDVVGEKIEEYVAKYDALKWSWKAIPAIRDRFDSLAPIERDVLLIRLANELEHQLDQGPLYLGNAQAHQQNLQRYGPLIIEMADRLGFSQLAAEMARVFNETSSSSVPVEVRNRSNQRRAYLIAPRSFRRPMRARFRRLSWPGMKRCLHFIKK